MYMFCLHICMCMLGTHRGQKRASGHLKLELWMIMKHSVVVGN